jgi:hypothetical protein
MVTFMSAEWFDSARSAAEPVALAPAAWCRLQFATELVRWYLVVEGGRVVSWGVGELNDPEAELHFDHADAWRIAKCDLDGNEALRRTTAIVELPDGSTYRGVPAPMDLGARVELRAMPHLIGANLTVHYRFLNGPFGDVDYVLDFVNGKLASEQLGPPANTCDAFIGIRYRNMGLLRTGQCTMLEAVEGGQLDGEVSSLVALAAIYETPEFEAAHMATGRYVLGLATLGELCTHPEFRTAMNKLMACTEAMTE